MIYLVVILIIIVCTLLIIAVLIQNPKGGGLGAGFGGMGNQVMGARRANDFIEKTTWSLVVGLLVLCLFSGVTIKKNASVAGSTVQDSEVENKFKENSTALPTSPAPGQRPGSPQQGPQQGPSQGPQQVRVQPQGGGQPQQVRMQPQGGQPQQIKIQPQAGAQGQQPAAQPQQPATPPQKK